MLENLVINDTIIVGMILTINPMGMKKSETPIGYDIR
jgi:hypothetical protein